MLPNIVRILSIILTTSATSASVERANLALCYIKTDFWSTMSMRCYCCMFTGALNQTTKKFIDMYAMRYPRMVLKNPLTEQ